MSAHANLYGALAYAVGLVSGLLMLLFVKDDDYVRFHARQSVYTFGAIAIILIVLPEFPVFDFVIRMGLRLSIIAVWVLLMIKALNGERFKLPFIGDLAEKGQSAKATKGQ